MAVPGFNPFTSPRAEEIEQKIKKLKETSPGLSAQELAMKIIQERAWQCALVGLLTALPAVVPGLGTLLALLGGVTLDVTLLTYLLGRMVLEVAAIYNKDLTGYRYRREAFWAFVFAAGIGSVGNSLSRVAVTQLSKDAFTALMERTLLSLGVRTTARSTLVRIIPLLGLLLAGGVNYFMAMAMGRRAIQYYEKRQEWPGRTINV
ncbi:hypothetical protein D7024_11230 [Desulfofundulus salinus]|uniref:EcsC family protein n=1 Tax=Desulfofundulus salinus TaxID=2419843 RepID=A0A494X3I9_9FIRM|nr:hypothetical protein D7024_11230 [Desulfofundulus salinum]